MFIEFAITKNSQGDKFNVLTAVVQITEIMNNRLGCSAKNVLFISFAKHRPSDFMFVSYSFLNGLVSKLGGSSAREALLSPNLDTRNWILTLEMSFGEPFDLKN